MARTRISKNSFSGGEVSPYLVGRGDLQTYDNAMAKIENLLIYPTGGVYRRPGLRFIDELDGVGRLISFEFNIEQTYLLVFQHLKILIYQDDQKIFELASPWRADQLPSLNWTQSADTLLLVHPDVRGQKLVRRSLNEWVLQAWDFYVDDEKNRLHQPYYKFASDEVTLQPSALQGTIILTANVDFFDERYVGTRLRLAKREVEVSAYLDPRTVQAIVHDRDGLVNTQASKDFEEQAFSDLHGYPLSVVFHQDRLVIGGTRDLPNRLWMSKSSDLFNFDLGEGLDDEAIEFAILSDQVNAIRGLFSSRHLQVFTSGAEWMVTGDPLTPETIQLKRQTRIGSPIGCYIPPRIVDGATLFVSRNLMELREFLFTDVEQAYQSNDLSLFSQHMMQDPVDQDYDSLRRHFYIVMGDGTLAALCLYRSERVSAWSRLRTQGRFLNVCVVDQDVYVLVEREGRYFVELFDDTINTDCALVGEEENPSLIWRGLEHLEGQTVKIVGDGVVLQDREVKEAQLLLSEPVYQIEVGLPYAHLLEPLAPSPQVTGFASQGGRVRLVSLTFRLKDTQALRLDVGHGMRDVALRRFSRTKLLGRMPEKFTGDISVRALGWHKNITKGLWSIEQDTPLPFSILSVMEELNANA